MVFQCCADRGCLLHREEADRNLTTSADEGVREHFWHSRCGKRGIFQDMLRQ